MKMKTKLFAFLAVALMLALPLAVFVPSADADSDTNDSIDDIADLQPIDLPEGFEDGLDGDAMLLGDSRATGVLEGMYPGSWTWDRTTGLGPYNSFYGAFDIDNGNAFVGVLDPYNLKKLVDGTDLSADGHYNIMWVLPTVYWSVDENGNVELSNDSTKGVAYAHTVDGHTYKYVAYGVYEGTPNDDGTATTLLTSESGKLPIVSISKSDLRTLAHAYTMDSSLGTDSHSMLWNFYQYKLYQLIGLSMMEDFNSQNVVGVGKVYRASGVNTGATETGVADLLGPYAGKIVSTISTNSNGNSCSKLLLENTWGGVNDLIDGIVATTDRTGFYLDSSSNPTDSTTEGGYVIFAEVNIPNNGFSSEISTSPYMWGYGTNTGATATTGICDRSGRDNTTFGPVRFAMLGGSNVTSYSSFSMYGLNYINLDFDASHVNAYTGSRLAFVFDNDVATFTQNDYDYELMYDPTVMATTSKAISVEGMDPISHNAYTVTVESADPEFGTVEPTEIQNVSEGSEVHIEGNTLTIGETVITATPAEGYRLASWSVANGDMITSETTITATFELIPVPEPVENKLLKLIPLIVIIALTVMAAIALMSFTGNGIDLIKLLIGLTVCVLFVAMAMIPAVGGF